MFIIHSYTVYYFFFLGLGTAASLEESAEFLSFHELSELVQALPGFLMLLTGEGKLLYLSDSVSEHLGHSMVSLHRTELLEKECSRCLFGYMKDVCVFSGGSGGTGGQRVRYHRRLRPLNHKDQSVNLYDA